MPTITFSGLGSGLDTSSWVEALVSVKQTTLTSIKANLETAQKKQSTISTLQASFSSLRSAVEKLTDAKFGSSMDLFANNTATSSNDKIFTATVTKSAARQNYDIKVEKLATKTTASSDKPVSAVADDNTSLSALGIKEGSMTVYVDGVKKVINIEKTDTVQDLKARLSTAGVDASIDTDGILNLKASNGTSKLLVGATNDTSNIKSLLGISQQEDGTYKSTSAMYKATTASKITESGLFSGKDGELTVKEGTFTIGDQEFKIDANTTISGLISQINSSEKAGATAYWDNANAKLVLTSTVEGQSYVNVEAGTSNFTDVMGFTETTWNADGTVNQTALKTDNQNLGDNAVLYVNGTQVISSSNTVTSDISRLEGVTLSLKGVNTEETGNTTLDVSQDTSQVVSAVKDVVDQYNTLMDKLDELTKSGGELHGDTALNSVKRSLRQLITSSTGNKDDSFSMLSQIGVSTAKAGASISADTSKIELDEDALKKVLQEDPDGVKKVIMGTASQQDGIFSKLGSVISDSLASNGYFTTATDSVKSEITKLNTKIEKQTTSIANYKSSLEAKFQAMEKTISSMQDSYKSFLNQSQ